MVSNKGVAAIDSCIFKWKQMILPELEAAGLKLRNRKSQTQHVNYMKPIGKGMNLVASCTVMWLIFYA